MSTTSTAACNPHATTVVGQLQASAHVKQRTADVCAKAIVATADLIVSSFRNGGKLMLCGNGGSAADCQHLSAEFTSRLSSDFVRPGLPALALTTDTSFLTAYANDFDFDGIFARQVQALGKPGDVLLAISTSGKSRNVMQAAQLAKRMGIKVVVLTGACERINGEPAGVSRRVCCIDNGPESTYSATPPAPPLRRGGDIDCPLPLMQFADVAICVPSDNTQHIQETHLAIEHILCHLIERALFGEHGTKWSQVPPTNNIPEPATLSQ